MTTSALSAELERFRERSGAPAVAAALVDADGLDAFGVVGVRRRGGADRAEPRDRWHVGSCAKAMTAALYARLVEDGKAAWETPIGTLFPDLAADAAPAWRERTIDELLRCRAGTPANLSPLRMRAARADAAPLVEQRSRVARDALARAPGPAGRFRYSNLAYVIAAAAIDRLAGMPWEEALTRYLLDPLGIVSVGFGAPPALCGHHALLRLGPLLAFPGKPAEPRSKASDNPPVLSAAGTLHLTVQDWARFVRVFVADGAGVLDGASVARLLERPAEGGVPMGMGWVATPESPHASHVFQGSNTLWAATAMLDVARRRACLVACNDGRSSVLAHSAALAERLLGDTA